VSKHPTTVTYLAMDAPFPKSGDAVTWPPGTQFLSLDQMPLDDYRKLYDSVGRDWHWVNRRHLTDAQLAGIIHHPATQIRVLHRGPKPIGFVELNMKQFPEVEIVFIGLVRLEIGLGLGQLMVRAAIQESIRLLAKRIIIQTCTLDHPSALPLYQKSGFQAYDQKQVIIHDD
jgi:hypothetical protein